MCLNEQLSWVSLSVRRGEGPPAPPAPAAADVPLHTAPSPFPKALLLSTGNLRTRRKEKMQWPCLGGQREHVLKACLCGNNFLRPFVKLIFNFTQKQSSQEGTFLSSCS